MTYVDALQARGLVREASMRLVDVAETQHWKRRGHFFAAATEAIRRLLIETARRKARARHGERRRRVALDQAVAVSVEPSPELPALGEALGRLENSDPTSAQRVHRRSSAGRRAPQAAKARGLPLRPAESNWTCTRAWLHRELSGSDATEP